MDAHETPPPLFFRFPPLFLLLFQSFYLLFIYLLIYIYSQLFIASMPRSHDLGVEAINSWLTKYPQLIHERFSKEFILESIKIILENNNFYFNDKMYTQVRGTAMGTKFAPTFATLVLAYLEEKLYVQAEIKYGK